MFGSIGGFELLVILAIGLLVFGPRKMPEIARTLGKTLNEFRRAAMEVRSSIERELDVEELKKATRSVTEAVRPEAIERQLDRLASENPKSDQDPAPVEPGDNKKSTGDDTRK